MRSSPVLVSFRELRIGQYDFSICAVSRPPLAFLRPARLLLPCVVAWACPRAPAAELLNGRDYVSRSWMVEQGLPHNTVNRVVQDQRGYLWLAGAVGLTRFDGVSFQDFPLPNRSLASAGNVRDLVATASGRLLLLPASGGVWEFANGAFQPHPITSAFTDETLLDLFVEPGGVVWVGAAPTQVVRWENGRVQRFGAETGIVRRVNRTSFAIDGNGCTWVASGEYVGRYQDGKLERVLLDPEEVGTGFMVAPAHSGGVWLSTSDRLMKWEKGEWRTLCQRPDWPSRRSGVECLFEDRQGDLWIGSRRHGVFVYREGKVRTVGMEARTIPSIIEDRDGNIWTATMSEGLVRLRPRIFTLLDRDAGLADTLSSSVCEDASGVVWCANRSGGLARYRAGRVERVVTNTRLDRYATRLAPDRNGYLWAASDTGLFRFPAGEPDKIHPTDPSLRSVQILFASRRGDMWVVSSDGIGYFRDGQYHQVRLEQGEIRARFNAIGEDSHGNIWIAANQMKAAVAETRVWEFTAGALIERISPAAWPAGPILSLRVDAQDRLWFGTIAGLVMKDGDRLVRLSTANGLPDDIVSEQLEDAEGRVWMGSRRGFFRVNQQELVEAAEHGTKVLPTVFGRDDGLLGASALGLGQPRTWRGHDGRLWFATHRGVVGFDPKAPLPGASPPSVYIESLICDAKLQSVNAGPVKVEPNTRRITFRFAVLNYSAPEQIRVRHRVEGYDVDWVDAPNERSATYSRLPPGKYRLRVIAANQAGVWNAEGASLPFTVEAAWWQTTWFWVVSCGLGAALIAWAARTWSVRKMRRKLVELEKQHALEQERARIARNLHDELGGSLTQIGLLAERVKRRGTHELEGSLNQLAWRTRTLAGDLESIVWTISPQNDSWDRLASFIAQFSRRFFKDTPIRCTVTGVENIPARPLGPDAQHEVLAVLKEALNNILKHSRAGAVEISVSMADDVFELRLSDDGVGFDPEAREHSERNGLSNMRTRGEAVGGQTIVTSHPGTGTVVTMRVPLKSETDRASPAATTPAS